MHWNMQIVEAEAPSILMDPNAESMLSVYCSLVILHSQDPTHTYTYLLFE